ncbi:MAG: YdiU family protein [Burkholderiales bacterium]
MTDPVPADVTEAPAAPGIAFPFDNSFARDLPGFYVARRPNEVRAPRLLFFNAPVAQSLGLDLDRADDAAKAAVFAGNALPAGAEPIAQAYAGHQFGGFSPQLGDGRALLLGEVIGRDGQRYDIALKGSGRTVFARGGDGKAAVGPMLREAIVSESMHALGIPTTRALAVAATGEEVLRDRILPGAVLTRVAASHLRVGTFQFYAARGDVDSLRKLALYTIARHDPALRDEPAPFPDLLRNVIARQASLIAQWMNVGFIHGVMNTDNMTISGETIDYGPCAFMEAYDPAAVFSSIDEGGRYAFGNQPAIAAWNLTRFAETLLPLLSDSQDEAIAQATAALQAFPPAFEAALHRGQRAKLGLAREEADDPALASGFLGLLHAHQVDFTLGWRRLADAAEGRDAALRALFADAVPLDAWLAQWRARCGQEDGVSSESRAASMRRVNPYVIARNHRVEEALTAASDHGDLAPFNRMIDAVRRPFVEAAELAWFAEPAPAEVTAGYQTFCGT